MYNEGDVIVFTGYKDKEGRLLSEKHSNDTPIFLPGERVDPNQPHHTNKLPVGSILIVERFSTHGYSEFPVKAYHPDYPGIEGSFRLREVELARKVELEEYL